MTEQPGSSQPEKPKKLPEQRPEEPPFLPEGDKLGELNPGEQQRVLTGGARNREEETLSMEAVTEWLRNNVDVLIFEPHTDIANIHETVGRYLGHKTERLKQDEILLRLKNSEKPATFFIMELNLTGSGRPPRSPVEAEIGDGVEYLKQVVDAVKTRPIEPGQERTKILLTSVRDQQEVLAELEKRGVDRTIPDSDEQIQIDVLAKPNITREIFEKLVQTVPMDSI